MDTKIREHAKAVRQHEMSKPLLADAKRGKKKVVSKYGVPRRLSKRRDDYNPEWERLRRLDPEYIAYHRKYGATEQSKALSKVRYQLPASIKRRKEYRARPEVRACRRKRDNARYAKAKRRHPRGGTLLSFGLSVTFYEELLASQKGVCAICGTRKPGNAYKAWELDHNHNFGCNSLSKSHLCKKCIRGLLCHGCNLGLGGFRDSTGTMLKAIAYLESFEVRKPNHPEE